MSEEHPYKRNLTVGQLEQLLSDDMSDLETAKLVCRWCYELSDAQIGDLDAGVMMGMVRVAFEKIGAALD